MAAACALARRGLGRVWPNPAVGCVIVDAEGRVAGRGWTRPGGRPHAETEALRAAGPRAQGGTAYVTLEPCSHHGETPPCADALVTAGIRRVVSPISDPDPRVLGAGFRRLRAAGVEVVEGVGRFEAEAINEGFFRRIRDGRPLVALKTATTLDGRIATHTGESQWITGELARARGHLLRAQFDAIMVGVGTAAVDNPSLTCRLPGLEQRSPIRLVVDGRRRLPLTTNLVATARKQPTWMVTLPGDRDARFSAFIDAGVEMIAVPPDGSGQPDLRAAMQALAERGLTRVLVEGGGHLSAALLRDRLIDRIYWFRAPGIIGGDGIPVAMQFGVDRLDAMARFERESVTALGPDTLETYVARMG
ncbi:MAG TPA: bifunctional diaminohydroxyphosphoribosylaminopyrimidine deaminase/5-amino-6-(5-phosphoribosylamino)uracil reductase RibD [Alphaproteobacteria bacterium]|jgi:diaminohydroxyphosphoribosylaminopyrimidine deaminase/5-amino-6-(5-phosphoribosylamino)uracil reductase|nr:bifunctional diaminohydroxyphosphoribosylaminopyrimidine deaminase/5-amino-6-(5-phosphoribosylamino)uracil reductase RibD [Alphaproteobacteria bacterium]